MRRLACLMLGLLVALPVSVLATAAAATAAPATADSSTISSATYEKRVRYWINVKREAHGLKRLKTETCTTRIARNWGQHLAESLLFYHQDMGRLLQGCDATYAGETLAKGAVRPRQIVKLWLASPGHRDIMLSKAPRRFGVGAFQDAAGDWVVAADFTRFAAGS